MATAASSLPTSTGNGNARFNDEAAAWDSNAFVHEASNHAARTLLARYPNLLKPPTPTSLGINVLELGCGTGLLSLQIAPYCAHLTAVDAAEGMIDVLRSKISKQQTPIQNITPLAILLTDPEDPSLPPCSAPTPTNLNTTSPSPPRLKYDLILSHLVLHHIADLRAILTTMLHCLHPNGGRVALTDFENFGPDAKSFHPKAKMPGVERHGIQRDEMAQLMREVGFRDVKVEVGWTMEKVVESFEGEFGAGGKETEGRGVVRRFPFVVCEGSR
jgi:2-polyprenyl-3-methyl-5-hydroxy-6-metoxy-1,4-benzoquinol methylase